MLEFTEDYKVGIPQLDEEHAHIIQLLNDASAGLEKDSCDLQSLSAELISSLQQYAKTHFVHEEAYMESINDPELLRQKKEHCEFMAKVSSFDINGSFTKSDMQELLKYLVHWIFRHILSSDMMIGKAVMTRKNPFEFTPEYATGIELIDSEHKVLFTIVKAANDLISNELLYDKYDEIMAILAKLAEYTKMHFSDEEAYMKSINYPKLHAQKEAHAAFIEKIVNIDLEKLDSIDENQHQYLVELIDFLLSWLINHILKSDKLIGQWERGLLNK